MSLSFKVQTQRLARSSVRVWFCCCYKQRAYLLLQKWPAICSRRSCIFRMYIAYSSFFGYLLDTESLPSAHAFTFCDTCLLTESPIKSEPSSFPRYNFGASPISQLRHGTAKIQYKPLKKVCAMTRYNDKNRPVILQKTLKFCLWRGKNYTCRALVLHLVNLRYTRRCLISSCAGF